MDAGVEHADDQLGEHGPDAAGAEQQDVGAQQHHRAHGLFRKRIAHARGMAADQVQLQPAQVAGRDAYVGELAEARRHAVHGIASGDGGFDGTPGGDHTLHRGLRYLDRSALTGNRHHVGDRKRMTVQFNWRKHGREKLPE